MQVRIYDCLYGASLYKKCFVSDEIASKCFRDAIALYSQVHAEGKVVGPININNVKINLESGEIDFPQNESCDILMNLVDTIKFLPPEIIQGCGEWNVAADLFCLALILFSVRYYCHPYDGMLVCDVPLTDVEVAKQIYGRPKFIFDPSDDSNVAKSHISGRVTTLWEKEQNQQLKDYFIQMFVKGAHDHDVRLCAEKVGQLFGKIHTNEGARILEINGKRITLVEGVEIYERDINPSCESNSKIGIVLSSVKNQGILALGNTTEDTWSVYLPDSKEIMVSPKGVAPIVQGATISIGEYLGNII